MKGQCLRQSAPTGWQTPVTLAPRECATVCRRDALSFVQIAAGKCPPTKSASGRPVSKGKTPRIGAGARQISFDRFKMWRRWRKKLLALIPAFSPDFIPSPGLRPPSPIRMGEGRHTLRLLVTAVTNLATRFVFGRIEFCAPRGAHRLLIRSNGHCHWNDFPRRIALVVGRVRELTAVARLRARDSHAAPHMGLAPGSDCQFPPEPGG